MGNYAGVYAKIKQKILILRLFCTCTRRRADAACVWQNQENMSILGRLWRNLVFVGDFWLRIGILSLLLFRSGRKSQRFDDKTQNSARHRILLDIKFCQTYPLQNSARHNLLQNSARYSRIILSLYLEGYNKGRILKIF